MRRFRVVLMLALVPLLEDAGAARQAAAPRSPRNASYTLTATLDPATRTVTGAGRLTWRNISGIPATELRFHLYWNAFRDAKSTWMRELALVRKSATLRPPEDFGSIDLTKFAIANGADLLARATFIAPDDGNTDDRTVLSVPLDRPVAPGETIVLDLGWTSRVPRTFSRTGVLGNYFFFGQWFPKIAVLEPGGWNSHQFHATTEFFADFGTYDVSLTVPAGWVVGATGREDKQTNNGNGTTTHRYVEDDDHDFAWTTSPDFVERRERFDDAGLPPVEMRLLLQPDHLDQAARHFTATRLALKSYGTWFGPYPYGHLTIVDPVTIFNSAVQGGSTGGMEYPTLITAGTRWRSPWTWSELEEVTIHEAGHQFWYGIVATNEFEHAWMDEGINTYSTAKTMAEAFPDRFRAVGRYFGGLLPWPYKDVHWSREIDGSYLNYYREAAGMETQSTPSWQYWPGVAGSTTYDKTALWMATLERQLGWPTVQKILTTYFQRGAFRHPAPQEFFAIANEVSGQDLTWFFDQANRSAATFDYAVADVTGRGSNTSVVVRRLGDGIFPVLVRVTFDDGSKFDEHWDGRDRWRVFRLGKPTDVKSVEIDPDRVLLLDLNYTNNSWSAQPRAAAAARKWSLRWLTWLEDLLLTYASFA